MIKAAGEDAKTGPVCVWLGISVLWWTVLTDAWGYSHHGVWSCLPEGQGAYVYGCLSRIVWSAPFLLIILYGRHSLSAQPQKLFRFSIRWKLFLIVLAALTALIAAAMYVKHGQPWINPQSAFWAMLIRFLIVGVTEELVYRGFGMNTLLMSNSALRANIIQSAFFAALHVPAYLIHFMQDAVFDASGMTSQVFSAFSLGLVFGYIFRKNCSLWPSVLLHAWYDFALSLYVG